MKFKNVLFNILIMSVIAPNHVAWAQNFGGAIQQEKNAPAEVSEPAPMDPEEIIKASGIPSTPASSGQSIQEVSKYTLGPTDVLEITVMRHPEVSSQFIVNSEGKIQYQFVGDIKVAGLTKEEASKLIIEKLSAYIVSPDVTVKIIGYNSKVVYVIGEVANPGRIFMHGDTITVREALLESGLPLLSASTKKCPLITPAASAKPAHKDVNVFNLLYEGDLRENLVMKPGDVLYIPATILSKAMRVISPVTQPVTTGAGGASAARTIATGGF